MPKLKRKSVSMRNSDRDSRRQCPKHHLDDCDLNSDEESGKKKRKKEGKKKYHGEIMRRLRQKNTYRDREKEKNAESMKIKRLEHDYREAERETNAVSMKIKRLEHEYREAEREKNADSMKIKRQEHEYREAEREKNADSMKIKRQEHEYREAERETNAVSMKIKRLEHEYREAEREKNADSMKIKRQEHEYREAEREKNADSMKIKRQEHEYRAAEREKNADSKKMKRQEHEYREAEREKNADYMKIKRQENEYREAEREKNADSKKIKRQEHEYREAGREKNADYMKIKRLKHDYREAEREKNVDRVKVYRQDTDYQANERDENHRRIQKKRRNFAFVLNERRLESRRKEKLRSHDIFGFREKLSLSINNKVNNPVNDDEYLENMLLMNFIKDRKMGPDIVCVCCENLFFMKSVEYFNREKIAEKLSSFNNFNVKEFFDNVVNNSSKYICRTCKKKITSGEVPKTAANTRLRFPVLPETIRNLTAVEERMVSPYLPFMQIKALQPYAINPQLSLKGSIVNIPVEINEMISILPRTFDEMSTIQIKLKRHLDHKSDYMYETIRPSKVCEALEYLRTTTLYTKNKLEIDQEFFEKYEKNTEVELDFIVDDEDKMGTCTDEDEISGLQSDDNESVAEDLDLHEENDEVLIIDRNQEVANIVQVIAPGQDRYPVPWHLTEHIDELCFPKIFGGEILDKENRLTYSKRVKFEARNKDRRSCEPTRILFMAKQKLEKAVMSSINICLRRVKNNCNLTVKKVTDNNFITDSVRHDDGFKFLKQIRSSPSYWENKKKHLLGMIRQCGVPTLFITLSACEAKNVDLLKILYKLRYDKNISTEETIELDAAERSKLIRDDPVTCVRYIEERFKQIMSILGNKHGPFGKNFVVDYFQRREFQARGSVHTHNLVYCNNAPNYDEEDNKSTQSLIEWIDTIISCENDPKNPLIALQMHRHTPTCYKGRRNKSICRFNIPMYVMRNTMILSPLDDDNKEDHKQNLTKIKDLMQEFFESNVLITFEDVLERLEMTEKDYVYAIRSSLSRTKIFLKRRSNEVAINGYNKIILSLLEANMDIQYVLDPYSCASYMINYVTKIDAGLSRLLREAAKDVHDGNLNLRQKFRKVANVFINGNTLSAQEAVYHVLGLPLSLCSRQAIYINTGPQNERVRMLKSQTALERMDGDSEDIYNKNIIEKYQERSNKLDEICLADFAASYEQKHGTENTEETDSDEEVCDNIEIRKRKKKKIIRFRRYKLQQDRHNYFREQLLLFFPWRNEIDEIENENCEVLYTKYQKIIEENSMKYSIIGDQVIEDALTDANDANQDIEEEEINSFMKTRIPKDQEIDIFGQMGTESGSKQKGKRITCPSKVSKEETMDVLMRLNDRQRQIIMHILNCFKTGSLPIRVYMSGSAGVGKSMVINSLYQLLTHHFDEEPGEKSDSVKILLSAPSGKAAFLIGGVTLHTAFALPITQFGGQMPDLSADIANTIRESLFDVKLLIIDEISMVGSTTLSRVDTRLRQIIGCNKSFGGISVLVVGDLFQLPPVMDSPVYLSPKSSMLSIFSENVLWNEFQYFELTEIMRQKEDQCFINALNHLARGEMTGEDITLIKSREIHEKDVPIDAIRLYAENRLVDGYNKKRIDSAEGVAYTSKAKDTVLGTVSSKIRNKLLTSLKNKSKNECGGLPHKVTLKIGINYMITSNINVEDGLVNGACGKLMHITFAAGSEQPMKIWLDFNNEKVGRKQRRPFLTYMIDNSINDNSVPISHISIVITVNERLGYQTVRQQFPITPAEAITIHKSQGQTYDTVCIDTRNSSRITRSMLYVALSRVTRLSGLFILGTFTAPRKPSENNTLEQEIKRLKQDKILQLSYSHVIKADGLKIIYQNVRSLRKNICHIACDKWYRQGDLLIFSESQSLRSDNLELDGFRIAFRSDDNEKRSSKGIVCFVKEELTIIVNKHIQKNMTAYNGHHHHIDLVHLTIQDTDIVTGYKSPTVNTLMFTKELKSILSGMKNNRIIIGDFNYDTYRKDGFIENHLRSLNFKRAIQTGISTTNFNTQIDIIFVDKKINNYSAGVYETYFSDHKPIFIGLELENKEHSSSMAPSCIEIIDLQKRNRNADQHNTRVISRKDTSNTIVIINENQLLSEDNEESYPTVTYPKQQTQRKPQTVEENVLEVNSWLDDRSINSILDVIRDNSQFNPGDIIVHQCLRWVEPVFIPDLQIFGGNDSRHWHCLYFDGLKLYIYDSLYFDNHTYESLVPREKQFIEIRYPQVTPTNVVLKNVTRQPDSNSCGVYAAAFATSVALGRDPSDIKYSTNVNQMRNHFVRIIREKALIPFPEELNMNKGYGSV